MLKKKKKGVCAGVCQVLLTNVISLLLAFLNATGASFSPLSSDTFIPLDKITLTSLTLSHTAVVLQEEENNGFRLQGAAVPY